MKTILDYLKDWKEVIVLCLFFLGGAGAIAKPWASDFINQTVDSRIVTLETKLEKLQDASKKQELSGIRTESDLASIRLLLQQLLTKELNTQPQPSR